MYNRIISITQDTSILERFYYIISKIPMVKEFPLGVGVGQYGTYVHSIFTQYNIPIVAPWVLTNLRSGTLDPWSFVLGMVAEGGIIIIPAILLFLSRMFHVSKVNRFSFAAFVSSTFLLFQTYPPATPYVWILFGLIWHRNMV